MSEQAQPTTADLQAQANAMVHAETAKQIGELVLARTSAEAIAAIWRGRAEALQADNDRLSAELAAARAEVERLGGLHAEHEAHLRAAQHTAAEMAAELEGHRARIEQEKGRRRKPRAKGRR